MDPRLISISLSEIDIFTSLEESVSKLPLYFSLVNIRALLMNYILIFGWVHMDSNHGPPPYINYLVGPVGIEPTTRRL